jgi:hypothetical protein
MTPTIRWLGASIKPGAIHFASHPAQTAADGFAVSLLVQLGRQDLALSDQMMNSGVSSMLTLKPNGQVLEPNPTSSQLRRHILSAGRKWRAYWRRKRMFGSP